jgi:hypothetical protein
MMTTQAHTYKQNEILQVPVAWRRKLHILGGYSYEVVFHESTKTGEGWEPLYTHPATEQGRTGSIERAKELLEICKDTDQRGMLCGYKEK